VQTIAKFVSSLETIKSKVITIKQSAKKKKKIILLQLKKIKWKISTNHHQLNPSLTKNFKQWQCPSIYLEK